MRYTEFTRTLVESSPEKQAGTNLPDTLIDRDTIVGLLQQGGIHNTKWKTANKLEVLVDIPKGANESEFRNDAMNDALLILKQFRWYCIW